MFFNERCSSAECRYRPRSFVRKIEKDFQILTDVTGMQKRLEKKELYKSKIKDSIAGLRSINARDVMKEVELVIKDNIAEGLLYKKV